MKVKKKSQFIKIKCFHTWKNKMMNPQNRYKTLKAFYLVVEIGNSELNVMLVIKVSIQKWMITAGIWKECWLYNAVIYDLDSRLRKLCKYKHIKVMDKEWCDNNGFQIRVTKWNV